MTNTSKLFCGLKTPVFAHYSFTEGKKKKKMCFALYTRLQLITRRDRCWVALRLSLPPQWVCALVNKQVVSELKYYLTRQQIPSPRVRIQTSNSVFKSKDRKISSRLFLTEIISQPHFLTKSTRMKLHFLFPIFPFKKQPVFQRYIEGDSSMHNG